MSKTYAVFPGLEALQQASRTRRWLDFPLVRETLDRASRQLAQITGETESLYRFLADNPRPYRADMERLFVAHTAIQVGIAAEVMEREQIDGLASCSMGDTARNVVNGATTLSQAVEIIWFTVKNRHLSPEGELSSVRPVSGDFSDEQIDWLDQTGVSVSLWSDRYAALSGTVEEIADISSRARSRGMKVRTLYPFPFHSRLMMPIAAVMREFTGTWHVNDPEIPSYSSILLRHIETPEDLKLEALDGAASPVRWMDAVRSMQADHGVTRLVNIGPTDTITAWITQSRRVSGVGFVDAWDICEPTEGSQAGEDEVADAAANDAGRGEAIDAAASR